MPLTACQDRRADALPRERDGRAGDRPPALAHRAHPADHLAGAQRGLGPSRRVRQCREHRPRQGRTGRGPRHPAGGRCSTPTTSGSRRWPNAPAAGWPGSPVPTTPRPADLVVRALDVRPDDLQRHGFRLVVERPGRPVEEHPVTLRLIGSHQVSNAIAAAAAAVAAGMAPHAVARRCRVPVTRSKWRMQLDERADGAAVINDAYNANPESVTAALGTLADLGRSRRAADPRPGRSRCWATCSNSATMRPRPARTDRPAGGRTRGSTR